jgi:acyl-coenzyme A thioesterase PaaI-like protein
MDIRGRYGGSASLKARERMTVGHDNSLFHTSCFACGRDNDHGLHLVFKDDPCGCSCSIAIPRHFQSYSGVVHGGIVATMLDAAMVHSLRLQDNDAPITCRLEIRYLQAVPPETLLSLKARHKGKRGKIVLADAELQDENNCYARARGAFIVSEQNEGWDGISP